MDDTVGVVSDVSLKDKANADKIASRSMCNLLYIMSMRQSVASHEVFYCRISYAPLQVDGDKESLNTLHVRSCKCGDDCFDGRSGVAVGLAVVVPRTYAL